MLRSDVTRLLASAPLVALAAITAPYAAHAQVTTGTVHGVVKDPSGKPFKGANVTLTSAGGDTLKTTSNSKGEYTFIGVQPGTYTVHVDVQAYAAPDQSVTVIQDQPSTADFGLAVSTVDTGTSKVKVSSGTGGTRSGQDSTQYNITARTEQLTKSQPNNLYQFPGLVFGQPGITPDPSGYTHIRGSDYNQVGFSVDGIDVTEPMTNSFATNIVTVGLKSANLLTGGADASYGGKTGGFINEATNNGRDLKGGILEYTAGPSGGWNYNGANLQYGNVVGNGKFDYYFASVLFKNDFPGNTQIARVDPSNDELVKLNYYIDSKDTLTAYANNGREKYNLYQVVTPGTTYKTLNPYTGQLTTSSTFRNDGDDQGYELSYLTFKHEFSSTSFATIQQYKLFSHVKFYEENIAGIYEDREATKSGTKIDYTNQLTGFDRIQAGFSYTPEQTHFREIASFTAPLSAAADGAAPALGHQYYNDFGSVLRPTETTAYLSNQARFIENKLTLDTGLRYSQQYDSLIVPNYTALGYTLPAADSSVADHYNFSDKFAPHYVDPRVGLTYSPKNGSNGITFRTSYSVNSQFADTQLVNRIPTLSAPDGPFNTVYGNTVANTDAAAKYILNRYAPFNALKPAHSNDFDLGVEKAFTVNQGFINGAYSTTLTGYRRAQYDLIQYDRVSLEGGLSGPRFYNNDGKGHATGLEFQFTKRLVNKTDWNGFVSYTNQTVRATNSDFDTSYIPYFLNSDLGDPNVTDAQFRQFDRTEYATSYDQKHTVGAVINKRFLKFLASSLVLDAGSGFPFAGGAAADGSYGGADSQHSEKVVGGADFTEVPTVLLDGKTIQPINPVVGRTGWHYKFSLNTDIIIKEGTSAFFNIDNVFTRNTPLTYATSTQAGQIYYRGPSAAYPQGQVYYGPSTIITPRFISFGIRTKF